MTERAIIPGEMDAVAGPRMPMPRPGRGLSFEEAMKLSMRRHRNVLAALAESERLDREAEVGLTNIQRGLTG